MKKFFTGSLIALSILIIFFTGCIVVAWNASSLPSPQIITELMRKTPKAKKCITEFYEHYNNEDFEYIYKNNKNKFPKTINETILFYNKYGKFKKITKNTPFIWIYLEMLKDSNFEKNNTFEILDGDKGIFYIMRFMATYEKGIHPESFILKYNKDTDSFKVVLYSTIEDSEKTT